MRRTPGIHLLHGIDGIADHLEKDLKNAAGISRHLGDGSFGFDLQPEVRVSSDAGQADGRRKQLMKINGSNLKRGFTSKAEHAIDECVSAVGLGYDFFRHGAGGRTSSRIEHQSRRRVERGIHSLFDFVGDASNDPA